MSTPKELNFFVDGIELGARDRSDVLRSTVKPHPGNWSRGLDWYRERFNPAAPVRGESSPAYTEPWFPGVAERMASAVPDAKLILMVRDPIERMISQWRYHRRRGVETRTLEESLTASGDLYLGPSLYHEMLGRYLAHFPSDQILVASQEDLLLRRRETMQTVYHFAGVAAGFWSPKIERERNPTGSIGRGYRLRTRLERLPGATIAYRMLPQEAKWWIERAFGRRYAAPPEPTSLDPAIRSRLADRLSDDVAALRKLTDRDFAGWTV